MALWPYCHFDNISINCFAPDFRVVAVLVMVVLVTFFRVVRVTV